MGKIPSIKSLRVEIHEIGFFVVFDEGANALGTVHVSGFLDDLVAKYIPAMRSFKVNGSSSVVVVSRYGLNPYCLNKPLLLRAIADNPIKYDFCFVSYPIKRVQSVRVLPRRIKSVGEIKVFGYFPDGLWVDYTPLGYKNKLRTPQIFVCPKDLGKPRSPKLIERIVTYALFDRIFACFRICIVTIKNLL